MNKEDTINFINMVVLSYKNNKISQIDMCRIIGNLDFIDFLASTNGVKNLLNIYVELLKNNQEIDFEQNYDNLYRIREDIVNNKVLNDMKASNGKDVIRMVR